MDTCADPRYFAIFGKINLLTAIYCVPLRYHRRGDVSGSETTFISTFSSVHIKVMTSLSKTGHIIYTQHNIFCDKLKMVDSQDHQNRTTIGIHINLEKGISCLPYPDWLPSAEKDTWIDRGIIVWNMEARRVACLLAQQALDVLDDLREFSSWKDEPFILGWNSYSVPYSEEDRKERRLSTNRR